MDDEKVFTELTQQDDENKYNESSEEKKYETPFVTGLPTWDLNPPYEVMKRGEKS